MTIDKLEIGEPIKPKDNPKNTWRIYAKVMHGDADKYETTKKDFLKIRKNDRHAGEKELIYAICLLIKILNLHHNDRRDFDHLSEPTAKECGYNYEPDMEQILCDLVPGDCTCDFQYKTYLESFRVVWFDENGIEHEVNIKD
jgi:hypothetical protein